MTYLPTTIPYPANEKPKLVLLEELFREWHQHFASPSSRLEKQVADGMVFDGFYPHYFSQKKRILFIGREVLEIAGYNYLEILYRCYRKDKRVGNQHLNRHKFHARMIRIAYGIVNEKLVWEDIPNASEIGDTFGTASGLSFAFMNISKLSNESGARQRTGVSSIRHTVFPQKVATSFKKKSPSWNLISSSQCVSETKLLHSAS